MQLQQDGDLYNLNLVVDVTYCVQPSHCYCCCYDPFFCAAASFRKGDAQVFKAVHLKLYSMQIFALLWRLVLTMTFSALVSIPYVLELSISLY